MGEGHESNPSHLIVEHQTKVCAHTGGMDRSGRVADLAEASILPLTRNTDANRHDDVCAAMLHVMVSACRDARRHHIVDAAVDESCAP